MSYERSPDDDAMMAAVEHSTRQLQETAKGQQRMLEKMQQALRVKTWQMRIGGAAIAVLLAACCLLGVVSIQAHDTAVALKADSITTCEQNNQSRDISKQIWDSFIQLILKGNTDPKAAAEGASFEALVAKAYAPRNCAAEYSNVGSDPASPNQADPMTHDFSVTKPAGTPANTEVVTFLSWDGYCLSAPSDTRGVRLDTVPCGSAHGWWYNYLTGYTTLEGHTDNAVGDSGGYLELKAPPGNNIATHASKAGPGGYTYYELWFGAQGTYFHAVGNGQDVTLSGTPSNALYWAILSDTTHHGGDRAV